MARRAMWIALTEGFGPRPGDGFVPHAGFTPVLLLIGIFVLEFLATISNPFPCAPWDCVGMITVYSIHSYKVNNDLDNLCSTAADRERSSGYSGPKKSSANEDNRGFEDCGCTQHCGGALRRNRRDRAMDRDQGRGSRQPSPALDPRRAGQFLLHLYSAHPYLGEAFHSRPMGSARRRQNLCTDRPSCDRGNLHGATRPRWYRG